MHVLGVARANKRPRTGERRRRWLSIPAVLLALSLAVWLPGQAAAHHADDHDVSHSLSVDLSFPDDGLIAGEQLCVALFEGTEPDLAQPPLLSRCLDPGNTSALFEGLPHGEYSVLFPGPGSKLSESRYQGQLVSTNVPDDPRLDAFGIDINLPLAPEFAGTTGRVEVNVYGCPAGTNAGADEESWAAECHALAGGVPLTLSGTGSIQDAAFQGVTGVDGDSSGRVEFSDLPPGAYTLGSELPQNVGSDPALFVESSIDGSLGTIEPSDELALRPTETVAVDVYLVLDSGETLGPESLVGLTDPQITGSVAADQDALPLLTN
jgi:hypothetical protein